ncbi:hypothetical protein JVU11DRAFT_9454 [Chiua virens]|nr:hypothetical protein JVU11DRAFT_9454 [Chiua virens]
MIHNQIDSHDEEELGTQHNLEEDSKLPDEGTQEFSACLHFGSPQKPTLFDKIEKMNSSNSIFHYFHKNFTKFIKLALTAYSIPFPSKDGHVWQQVEPTDMLQEFRYLKVNYKSTVDWKLATYYLQCSPAFHGNEHYDCVLIQEVGKQLFARLLFMF